MSQPQDPYGSGTRFQMRSDLVVTRSHSGAVTLTVGSRGVTLSAPIVAKLLDAIGRDNLPFLPGEPAARPLNMHTDSVITTRDDAVTITGPADDGSRVSVEISGPAFEQLTGRAGQGEPER
jgi:hypothetical protein